MPYSHVATGFTTPHRLREQLLEPSVPGYDAASHRTNCLKADCTDSNAHFEPVPIAKSWHGLLEADGCSKIFSCNSNIVWVKSRRIWSSGAYIVGVRA